MARPRKTIDRALIFDLASKGRKVKEIAAICDCSTDLLQTRFSALIDKGHEAMKGSLRAKQYEVAMSGNPTMLVWLGKQLLDQSDKAEFTGKVQHEHVDLSHVPQEELEKIRELVNSAVPSASGLGREL